MPTQGNAFECSADLLQTAVVCESCGICACHCSRKLLCGVSEDARWHTALLPQLPKYLAFA
jgi:hypothetical protein